MPLAYWKEGGKEGGKGAWYAFRSGTVKRHNDGFSVALSLETGTINKRGIELRDLRRAIFERCASVSPTRTKHATRVVSFVTRAPVPRRFTTRNYGTPAVIASRGSGALWDALGNVTVDRKKKKEKKPSRFPWIY